ncbi:D-alanyl-D-alanine carboxypeptidase [Rhizobiaceae bacterium BDR2-2]|uniref:D-alanyl-D-alanine carboxypeptidase n=1 Tax=Ectorhizobium quercum TaxID=2965071 RepID=A0AAE3N0A8_9HYPH|nr:D-alanyl-D-alanine carboxypeptidase [Ectorhizobium quercum]MCX8997736.1 D-alanyl-D-alanine carboxypeptidase [Ectorhizobium quercum]
MAAATLLAISFIASPAKADPKYAGIVVDARTGKVLYSDDADTLRYPASLTKMMTLYLTFEALEAKRITLDTPVPVSKNAAAEPPSKLGVRAGGSLTVEQAIMALITRSANDIATALGEFIGGSEARFAQMMTNKAHALGMTRTTYRNAHGLPNTAQMTTARDQARLGMALRQHFPQYYGYFSTRSFNFGKQVIGNHNRLLGNVRGVDGIKTGYTRAAGFNLVTSAQADGRSVVGVVMGGKSGASRDQQMRKLIATYMPQASQGPLNASDQIAALRPATPPKKAPVPVPAPLPTVAAPSVAKVAASTAAAPLPVASIPVPESRYGDESMKSAYAAPQSQAQIKAAAPVAALMAPAARAPAQLPAVSSAGEVPGIDRTTTASTKPVAASSESGWVIQIGAAPNESSAMTLLQAAQEKGGQVLRSAKPFTAAFNANGSEIYRARFAGFGDQKAAVNACNALKKKGMNCWASLQ